jgi:hypothetical protein
MSEDWASNYKYQPKWDRLEDRHPDKRPSNSAMYAEDRGKDTLWAFEVRGLGAIVMRAKGAEFSGVSIFTTDDILFERE